MKTIYLIEKLWLDPMENHSGSAMGYDVVGYLCEEEIEKHNQELLTTRVGDGWPIMKGKVVPRYKVTKLERWNQDEE